MNRNLILICPISLLLLFQLTPYATASFWALSGTVRDGGNCQLLSNVTVSSQYNDNAANLSNSKGQYLLLLGSGNWTVTVYKEGYEGSTYGTPYMQGGALAYDFYLLRAGEAPVNCSSAGYPLFPGSIVNASGAMPKATTITTTVPQAQPRSQAVSSPNGLAWIAILLLLGLWIAAIIHYRTNKDGPKSTEAKVNK